MFIEPIIKNEALDYDGKLLPLYETESFLILENIISNWTIRNCNLLASEIFNICSSWPELRTVLINPELHLLEQTKVNLLEYMKKDNRT